MAEGLVTAMARPPNDDRVEYKPFPEKDSPLFLRRGNASRGGKAVLLLHGASASCDTFLQPRGSSLFDYLNQAGLDVWMLDWRGSFYVTANDANDADKSADYVAENDIPQAIKYVRDVRRSEGHDDRIAVLGHCVGAATLSMSIGAGFVEPADVDNVVLSSIGLFYEVTWDGWTKIQDRTLERVADADATFKAISPAVTPWPPAMETTYALWPTTWGPPWEGDFFRRLAFLFGQPFLVSNLHAAMDQEAVRKQFGAIPFTLYRHAAQNALRGFAAPFDAEGLLPEATKNEGINAALAETYMKREAFSPFGVTLLTGAENPLWHRDSIDRMGEWLARIGRPFNKHVLDGYGHQDLWWGKRSWHEVFPLVKAAVL